MTNRKTRDKGWFLYTRRDHVGHVLHYRVAPGDWRDHRVPSEYRRQLEAERYAVAWLEEYGRQRGERRPVAAESATSAPTIRGLAAKWSEFCADNGNISPATRKQHRTNMAMHVLAYSEIADVPIADLARGPALLRAWVRNVRDHGKVRVTWEDENGKRVRKLVRGGSLAPFTSRNVVNSLTAFFADAMAEEWVQLPANPMKHEAVRREVPEGRTVAGKNTIIHFTRPIAEKLLTCPQVPEWRRVRALCALTSGMDEGELAALRIDDVDLEASIPVFNVTKALPLEGPDGWATLGPTKTDNRVRKIPVHPLAIRALRGWKASGWARWVGRPPKATDPLFPSERGEYWRADMADLLRRDLRAAGLPDHYEGRYPFTAKATRRTFATWLAEGGIAEGTIKRLMGHAGGSVTQRHYTARTLETLRAAIETLQLDLTTEPTMVLPMEPAAGEKPTAGEAPQTAGDVAERVANRDKPATRAPESETISSTPGATRTHDPRLRRPLLYPAELRARMMHKIL